MKSIFENGKRILENIHTLLEDTGFIRKNKIILAKI